MKECSFCPYSQPCDLLAEPESTPLWSSLRIAVTLSLGPRSLSSLCLHLPSQLPAPFPLDIFAFPGFHLGDRSWPWLAITVTILTSLTFGSCCSGQHLLSLTPPQLASPLALSHPLNPPPAKPALAPPDWGSEKLGIQSKPLR